ncbi:MAG: glycosyltransferase family 1 protein [Patescibacteria group bacterium]
MRIVIDIRLLGRGNASGIREYTYHIIEALFARAPEHEYILFYPGLKKSPLPTSWTGRPNVSVVSWRIPNKLLELGSYLFPRFMAIDARLKADLIFSPHINILVSLHTPRFLTIHDLSFIHYPDFFGLRERIWHSMQHVNQQVRQAERIITNSYFTETDIVETLRVPKEKISVVYPGIHKNFRKLDENDPAMNLFIKNNNIQYPFILALGTIEPRKNITAIIQAFNALKKKPEHRELRLIIVGNPGWLHRDTLKAAAVSEAKDHIIFWGKVKNEERIFLYNKAEALAYPSFFEGFGFPPLEAQACGCPVVTSDRSSFVEIIGASGITVNPWSVYDLTYALHSIMTDHDLRAKLIAKGLLNAKRFTWEKTAEELLSVFINAKNNLRHPSAVSRP